MFDVEDATEEPLNFLGTEAIGSLCGFLGSGRTSSGAQSRSSVTL